MKFTTDKQDNYTILALLEPNLNTLIAPELKSEFVFFRNEGVANLILDLSEVEYVDSSGLSAILTANRLWKSDGSFVLTGIEKPAVKKLIEISRLDSILTIEPSVEEAVSHILVEDLQRDIQEEE